jgi:hypothetical protein
LSDDTTGSRAAKTKQKLQLSLLGLFIHSLIDGRPDDVTLDNGSFDARSRWKFLLWAAAPGLFLLALGLALAMPAPFWSTSEPLTNLPIAARQLTSVERDLIGTNSTLRGGVWEAVLLPWSMIPADGMSKIGDPGRWEKADEFRKSITAAGESIEFHAPLGQGIDNARRTSLLALRQSFTTDRIDVTVPISANVPVIDMKRPIGSYHFALLSLWAGYANDAGTQFERALLSAQGTLKEVRAAPTADTTAVPRLEGIIIASHYGLGLVAAALHDNPGAIAHYDAALKEACDVMAAGGDEQGYSFDGTNYLVPLSLRSIRNDRLVALLQLRSAGTSSDLNALSPSCTQLRQGAGMIGDERLQILALTQTSAVRADPFFQANLELWAARLADRDLVAGLFFDTTNAPERVASAQAIARTVVGLDPPPTNGSQADLHAIGLLRKLSNLKATLNAGLRIGDLHKPELDADASADDTLRYNRWIAEVSQEVSAPLVAWALAHQSDDRPQAAALEHAIVDAGWLQPWAQRTSWCLLYFGMTFPAVLWLAGSALLVSLIWTLGLVRVRATYRETFNNYHKTSRHSHNK